MKKEPLMVADGIIADGVLIDAPPPLGVLWVPLQRGLTVLYGRNGAGKSRLLRAITGALRGEAMDEGVASLHLSLVAEHGGWNPELMATLAAWLRHGSWPRLDGGDLIWEPEPFRPLPTRQRDGGFDWNEADEWVGETVGLMNDWMRASVPDQIGLDSGLCHTPRLSLVAVGTAKKPAWEAHISVVPTDPGLFVAHHVQQLTPDVMTRVFDRSGSFRSARRSWPGSLGLLAETLDSDQVVPVQVRQLVDPNEYTDWDQELIDAADVLNCRDASEDLDLERLTLEGVVSAALDYNGFDLIDFASNDEFQPSEPVSAYLEFLRHRATWLLTHLSGDQLGSLEPRLLHPNQWLAGRTIRWFGVDPYGQELPVSALGAGSQRWANLAISMALRSSESENPAIFVVDEPERALHSAAQVQAANAMTSVMLHDDGADHVVTAGIVASHSPAFLANPDARLVHVSRNGNGTVRLDEIDVTIGVEALVAQLGLTRSDALLSVRTFVYVEGEHDLAIIGAVYGDVLRDRHAVLRAMRGAANLEAHLAAEHILAFSDAKIRVILDRIGALTANEWSAAVEAFRAGEITTARRLLDSLPKPGRGREAVWLSAAGVAALNRGQLDRIELVGLEKPDIIQYLPVASLLPKADSWSEVVHEWRSLKPGPDFKSFLRDHKGARFDSSRLAEIAERLEPRDLADLVKVVEEL